jgi:uncharacterized damage-inducible protein DinB
LRFANRLSQAEADETVRFKLLSGTQAEMRRREILLHVVNHTSYHRGFVADLFHQIPITPPETDLPVFLPSEAEPGD